MGEPEARSLWGVFFREMFPSSEDLRKRYEAIYESREKAYDDRRRVQDKLERFLDAELSKGKPQTQPCGPCWRGEHQHCAKLLWIVDMRSHGEAPLCSCFDTVHNVPGAVLKASTE